MSRHVEKKCQTEEPGEQVTIRLPQETWEKLRETLELDAKSSAFDPKLREEIREALDQVEGVAEPISCPACGSRGGVKSPRQSTSDRSICR